MRIHVQAIGTETDGATRSRVEQRLRRALGRSAHSVLRVGVRVEGNDGTRGGGAAGCSIEACLRPVGTVIIFKTGRDALEAADRAVDSAASAIRECLGRRKDALESSAGAQIPGG
jgi:hypothetical protein